MIASVAILLVFAVFALLMYRRIMPALLAVPAMAVCMAAVAGVPAAGIADIFIKGSYALSGVFVAVIFGAMLGRITIDTGIARSIVNFAAEFAGDRPPVVCAILCAVVAALFVSFTGLGAIIMVGSIVLPIMMTTGVPRKIAATLFLMAFALGFIFNITNWQFYTKTFGVTEPQLIGYALVLAAIDLLAMIVYAIVAFRTSRDYATWAVAASRTANRVPWYALITPVLPIVLYFALHVDAIAAFAISAVYGALAVDPRLAIERLVAAAIRGIEDVAPAIFLFIGIGMLATAVKVPQFATALHPLVSSAEIANPIVFVVLFGLLSPLALYRGPLNPFGVGIAIFTALLAAHSLPPLVLVAAIMAVVQVQNVCDPTNTANVWVGNFTGVHVEEITKRTLPYQVAVATVGCIAIVVFGPRLFGATAFAPVVPAAVAAEELPGLFARPSASGRVGVGADSSAHAARAAGAIVATINTWPNLRAFRTGDDPNTSDCSAKPYAAYIRVVSTDFQIIEGTDTDIGLLLWDCAGWGVDEWHEHAVFPGGASLAQIDVLAARTAARMQRWMLDHPVLAQHLFAQGLAYDPATQHATYFYSLFKTIDGQMRTFVRPGGPAYASGMRTNDIVDKLDGKFWWEYGTYQTQLRAYDGKPHAFDLERGSAAIHVELGAPFGGPVNVHA